MRVLLVLLFLAAPLLAQEARSYESAFGVNTLANCDLIVHAIASAKRAKVGAAISVELNVQEALHGTEKATTLTLVYSDKGLLKENESVEGLFALRALAEKGYTNVGRPVPMPSGDAERSAKISVCKAFIELEKLDEGEARTKAFDDLLAKHLAEGGYPGENAAVELLLWVARKPAHITRERYKRFSNIFDEAKRRLDKIAKKDVELALAGMVESRLKNESFREVRRGKTKAERVKAAGELTEYFKAWPRAFVEDDAVLAEALAKECNDGEAAKTELSDLGASIRRELLARKIAEETRRAEEADKVKHAGGEK